MILFRCQFSSLQVAMNNVRDTVTCLNNNAWNALGELRQTYAELCSTYCQMEMSCLQNMHSASEAAAIGRRILRYGSHLPLSPDNQATVRTLLETWTASRHKLGLDIGLMDIRRTTWLLNHFLTSVTTLKEAHPSNTCPYPFYP